MPPRPTPGPLHHPLELSPPPPPPAASVAAQGIALLPPPPPLPTGQKGEAPQERGDEIHVSEGEKEKGEVSVQSDKDGGVEM